MNIVIFGNKGLLGSYLSEYLKNQGENVFGADKEINIVQYRITKMFLNQIKDKIDIIINCAAYTDVPKAELETEKVKVNFINHFAVGVLSRLAKERKAHLIHFSTDFVFSGNKNTPYVETDTTDPINFYGDSKRRGENSLRKKRGYYPNHTIFRLQWLYWDNPKTFFMKLLEKAKENNTLKIVNDEIGSPSSVKFVSEIVSSLIREKNLSVLKGKIFHITHDNYCSRYESAKYFLEKMGINIPIEPLENYIDPLVKRPKYGVLDNSALKYLMGKSLGTWEEDVDNFISCLKNAK